jgi:RHS repeat-associated protein
VSGTWSWTASYTGDTNNNGASSACTQETVTVTNSLTQGACQGSGSISTLVIGTNVISYVPNGHWQGIQTGIDVVTVEGDSTTKVVIPTGSDVINSCASNSLTGQTVCTANNTHVYVLRGTGLDPTVSPNPLVDGGSGTITFSGGSPTTSGVSMDPADNKALLALSVNGVGGFQFLDLTTNTFEPPITTGDPGGQISEDPLIDPVRHLIASAAEDNNFELADVTTTTTPRFFEHPVSSVNGKLDSTSEDCSTGILLAPAEFSGTSQVEIADINKPGSPPNATFTPGTPGSWTAPEQVQTLTGSQLSDGANGSSVAQGTHTGVISGEFGGDGLTALALPTTSGAGATPAITNWVSCEIGSDPSGHPFNMGNDPHTLVAYQSPNGGHAIALFANGTQTTGSTATELVKIDLTNMLNPAIVPATNHVCTSGTLPPSVESFIPVPAPPSFTARSPDGIATLGEAYSYTFAATGSPAPIFYVSSGALPTGLSLDAISGTLSGTPTTGGEFTFTVTANNGVSPDAVTATLTIIVLTPLVFTAAAPPPQGAVGSPYSYTFTATGFPEPLFSLASGALPEGLSLDEQSGTLSGTPTIGGTFTFTVSAQNGLSPDAVTPTLTITIAGPPVFTADSPPSPAAVGIPYTYTFAVTGNPAATFAVSSGTLPDGLRLDAGTGTLSGVPTTTGTSTFTVTASNGLPPDAESNTLTIIVEQPVAPAFTADSPPSIGSRDSFYFYTFAATGTPTPTFHVSSGALPGGLSLDAATGTLAGTPTTAGTFNFTIAATNGVNPDALTHLRITITPPRPGANNDSYTVQSGRELDVTATTGVLANDASPEDLPLTALIENDNALGTVVLHPDGSFSYVPPSGFTGTDTFTYKARDSHGTVSNLATVSIDVTAGGPPTPTISTITPTADTTITGPTPINVTLTAPAGETVSSWTVSYRRPGDPTLIQLASGTGPNVSATFDPTLVQDGTYALDIKATSSGGGILQTASALIVDGSYKPGRYSTTVSDMTVNAANIPIHVQRTYDSINKTQGDFGAGWTLNLADFRTDTNGALGNGGWAAAACGGFLNVCFSSTIPHVVSVTWPDGHVEKFDLTPPSTLPFLGVNTTAEFTAEPGSTSNLQAVDNAITLINGTFYAGTAFLGTPNGVYDPLQFILTAKDGTQYLIDRHDGLLSQTDASGNRITIDSFGIHSSNGPSVTFNRDAENRISQIVGPTGTTTYTYSSSGDLASVAYPNGSNQSYTYDNNHDLLSISGGGQVVRTLTYDASGRITSVTDGDGHTSTIATNVTGHQQVITDATGKLTTVDTFDDRGDLIQRDQSFGGRTVTTKATYDALGHQLSFTDPLGHTTSQTYDSAGNILATTDANGKTTSYTYNSFGEALTVTDPTAATTANTYDAAGNLLTTTDPNGNTTTNTYDRAGHLLTTTDPNKRVTTRTYDTSGQLASITDAVGNTTHQAVDPATGRVTAVTDPTGATTTFAYDADGNTTGVTDANGHTRTATYDAFDRVTSLTDPTGNTDHNTYDAAGNLISVTDRDGVTVTYTYDPDSRLVSKTVPGAGTTTYTNDPLGRQTAASNSTAQLAFTYDDAGHMLTATSTGTPTSPLPTTTFTYAYDPAGNRTSTVDPGGTTNYTYDPANRLTGLIDPAGGAFTLAYNLAGQQTTLTRPNGITDATNFDPAGNLTSLHSTLGPNLVNQADYTHNTAGIRSSVTTTNGTTGYTYDKSNQLTSATYPAGSGLNNEAFTYDPVGNRTSATGSQLGSFTYDSGDRLQADATNTYAYDKEGNLLTRVAKAGGATTSYTWTAEHQLTGITYPDGTIATFRYDPLGRRVEIDEGVTVTRYAYDGANLAAEYDATNTRIATYTQDPTTTNRALEMVRGGQRYFYLADAQGSTTALTTLAGATAATYTYTAFGAPTETGGLANPITYTGQFYDGVAHLLLYPTRPMDPALGRFLSEDPAPSVNPYPYVQNDPPNQLDPSGSQALTEYAATAALGCLSGLGFGGIASNLGKRGFSLPPHLLRGCLIGAAIAVAFLPFTAAAGLLKMPLQKLFLQVLEKLFQGLGAAANRIL